MNRSIRLGALGMATILVAAACAGGPSVKPVATTSPPPSPATSPSTVAASAAPLSPSAAPSPSAASSPSPGSSPAGSQAPAGSLQALLDAERISYGAPGALVVHRAGTTRTWAASGAADLAGTPITETTTFRVASITKPIMATLVLDAVAHGKLRLDANVGDLLPGVLRADQPVTVRMLLDHTSGIYDESNGGNPLTDLPKITDPALRAEGQDLAAKYVLGQRVNIPDRLQVALSETHDRYFAPGTGYHYSNTNYQLIGMILQKVTGTSLADLLRTKIAAPLGLRRVTIAPPETRAPGLRGYGTSRTDGSLVDVTDDSTFFGNGAEGGVITTADELLAIMQAIAAGRLLPADLAAEMRRPNRESYGLGLATYSLTCGRFLGHEGGLNGTASIAIVAPDGSSGIVAALNLRSGGDPRLPAFADGVLCGER